jgi:hypothetical protein
MPARLPEDRIAAIANENAEWEHSHWKETITWKGFIPLSPLLIKNERLPGFFIL